MAAPLSYRPFLDGLRAIAVLAVIGYHLDLEALPGGFLGVDVFFVLSGYLITRLLLAEKAATGRIDFLGFYARRLKRLMPALLLTLAAVLLLARWLYAPDARFTIARDATSSLLYVANWSFIAFDQSYFDAFAEPSPLRHMWSLAVEEQFYMVWPLLVLVLPTGRGRGVAIVAMAAALSALLLAVLFEPGAPSRAYYGTDARIHEPLIGALAALLWVRHGRRLDGLRHAAMPCLLAIAAAVALVDDQAPAYYRGLSTGFCGVTALLILSLETGGARWLEAALGSRPLVWTGKISYGMYLWHWPIVVALGRTALARQPDAVRALVVLGATLAIAALSYHLLERRIRHARGLLRPLTLPRLAVVLAIAAVLVVPIVGGLRGKRAPAWASDTINVTGTGDHTIAVIGDSIAKSLVPALVSVAAERGWTIIDAARGGCSIAGGYQVNPAGEAYTWSEKCAQAVPHAFRAVAARRPDVVVWQSHTELNLLRDPATGIARRVGSPEHDALLWRGWEAALAELRGIPVVIIAALHEGPRNSRACRRKPHRCADDGSNGEVAHLNALLRRFADAHPGVRLVSIDPVVCPSGPPCPAVVDGVELRPDGFHFSEAGGDRVVAALLAELAPATGSAR